MHNLDHLCILECICVLALASLRHYPVFPALRRPSSYLPSSHVRMISGARFHFLAASFGRTNNLNRSEMFCQITSRTAAFSHSAPLSRSRERLEICISLFLLRP